ncbi:MAG: hypothetical protein NTU73_05035 [Ignavibacteriae bacterium]|nr:hypothetical protein [Ignavibacteriota bacterium]
MLDNDKLNKRLKNIFKYLKQNWGIKPYRIAVETGIPHSSLKYMVDSKFEWKLNHLLAVIDFLNRYGAMISLTDLLDFKNKKSLEQIMDTKNADFRIALINVKRGRQKYSDKMVTQLKKKIVKETKPVDYKVEADALIQEIGEVVLDNRLIKNSKIVVGLKINGKNFDIQKNISFVNGKISKK